MTFLLMMFPFGWTEIKCSSFVQHRIRPAPCNRGESPRRNAVLSPRLFPCGGGKQIQLRRRAQFLQLLSFGAMPGLLAHGAFRSQLRLLQVAQDLLGPLEDAF